MNSLSNAPKTLGYVPLDALHILACEKVPVANVKALLPRKYLESLEQNQKIASCCRHPENHEIEAWYSCPSERDKKTPDIYKFHCTCGRVHVRFCVGGGDKRPFWQTR